MISRTYARMRSLTRRRIALLLGLAAVHLALLVAAGWLVASRTGTGPIQVLVLGMLGLMALVVLFSPGSAAALVFVVGCGGGYVVLSALESEIGDPDRAAEAYQVLALAATLFLVHAVDALREVLPSDAAIESAVIVRWVQRTSEALVPGLLIGGLLVALPTAESRGGVFWLVGAAGLLLAAGLPALALRPRPWVTTITDTEASTEARRD